MNNIRTKLRSVGRLLMQLRESIGNYHLIDMIKPTNYEKFVQAVRQLSLKSDQLGLTLTNYVKQLALMKREEGIVRSDKIMRAEGDKFLEVYNSSWTARVSSHIGRRQRVKKINQPHELPIEDDLRKLRKYIRDESDKSDNSIRKLKKLVLADLMVFNKRRPMEIHNMTIEAYRLAKSKMMDPADIDIINKLTSTEQVIASRYVCLFAIAFIEMYLLMHLPI